MITLTILVGVILLIAILLGAIFAIGLGGIAIIGVLFSDILVLIGIIWIVKKLVGSKGKKGGKSK